MLLGAGASVGGGQDSAEEAYFARWEEKNSNRLADASVKVVGAFNTSMRSFHAELLTYRFSRWCEVRATN